MPQRGTTETDAGADSLKSLDLSHRGLTEFPLEEVRGARSVRLVGNRIRVLPPEIGELRDLKSLKLSDNAIESIPPEIGKLEGLLVLELAENSLQTLPPEIGNLPNLYDLDLGFNQLRELPPELGNLTALGFLTLQRNRLTALPDLRRCTELSWLDVDQNELEALPAWIGELKRLGSLYADDNRLTRLPAEIGSLPRLGKLSVRRNRLRSLPSEIVELPEDVALEVHGNDWDEPLASLVGLGTRELFSYLRSLTDAEDLYEAKLLLLGEGDVGKSSLRDALLRRPFVEGRSTTHGIELRQLKVPHPQQPVEIVLNMWDFGGQPVYRITHQFFFSRRAVYLVVWKPREGVEENAVEPWCRRIRLRVGSEATILIVATHANERSAQLDYPSLQAKFGDMLAGHFEVDNSDRFNIDEKLLPAIATIAASLPQMGEAMSAAWRRARDAVLARPEPQIPYADFVANCHPHGLDEEAAGALARMLHELGVVVYYGDDEGLRDVIVLNPEWLTKAISYVLEDKPTLVAGGVLDHHRLQEIWGAHDDQGYPPEYYPYFVRLMEKFDVSYRMADAEGSLVGQLVPYERPHLDWSPGELAESTRELSLVCELEEPTDGLVAWFTVRHHRFGTGLHWRRGVLLRHAIYGAEALFEQLDDRGQRFALTVRGPSPESFFSVLRDGVEYLLSTRWTSLGYELLVPCRGERDDGSACSFHFRFRHLTRFREEGRTTIDCHECGRQLDVAELLTGFRQPDLQAGMGRIELQLDYLSATVDEVRGDAAEIRADTTEIRALAADSAGHIRRLLKAVTGEVSDCPRLFTFVGTNKGFLRGIVSGHQVWYRLTLWCEHPDHEHPWDAATYTVKQPKEWVAQIAPYAALVVRTLQLVVPIAGAAAGVTVDQATHKEMKAKIDLMKAVVQAMSSPEVTRERELDGGGLTRAEGTALQLLRATLLDLDKAHVFGGLRRRQTAAGDWVWICPEHYPEYDPGLPELPAPRDTPEAAT